MMTGRLVSLVLAVALAGHPVAAYATGNPTAYVVAEDEVTTRVEATLPENANDLNGCMLALSESLPAGLGTDPRDVEITFSMGKLEYDVTRAFDVTLHDGTLRAECDSLRQELPVALAGECRVRIDVPHVAGGDLSKVPIEQVIDGKATLASKSGSARVETLSESETILRVATLETRCASGSKVRYSSGDFEGEASSDSEGITRFVGVPLGKGTLTLDDSPACEVTLTDTDGRLGCSVEGEGVSGIRTEGGVVSVDLETNKGARDIVESPKGPNITLVIAGTIALAGGIVGLVVGRKR